MIDMAKGQFITKLNMRKPTECSVGEPFDDIVEDIVKKIHDHQCCNLKRIQNSDKYIYLDTFSQRHSNCVHNL